MERRGFWAVALVALAACQGGETTKPSEVPIGPPSFLITDGAHAGGNSEFFWLWPMVPPPINHPNYNAGAANGELRPDIFICALNATTPAQVINTTPCKTGGYTTSFLGVLPGFHVIAADDDIGQYHQFWKVPNSSDTFYRIRVKVGAIELGVADVQTSNRLLDLLNVNKNLFTPQLDGTNMLIRFRIEQFALCPITRNCASEAVNLALGGNVTTPLPGTGDGGVDIPPQGAGPTTTVTVKPCDATDPGWTNMNPAVTDLPTFGPCVTVTATPPLAAALINDATVFICDIHPVLPIGMDHEQSERITLHRYDPGSLTALPHAPHVCQQQVGSAGSIKGVFASLARGSFRSAGRELVSMLSPRALYASAMLDVGAGGFTDAFSAYQFALPARLRINAGNGQGGLPGLLPIDPQVIVEDVAGEPVAGARVRFGATLGACLADAGGVTAINGLASRPWTIVAGPNTRYACGRGLGGSDFNGPRSEENDPFQPIQAHFDDFDLPGGPFSVPVLNGSVTFTANGFLESIGSGLFDFGAGGWSAKQVGEAASAPAGWQDVVFNSLGNGFSLDNPSAFGATDDTYNCPGLVYTTPWALGNLGAGEGNDILVRKLFSTPSASGVQIRVSVDNDLIEVWLNGVQLNESAQTHEGCANPGTGEDYVFDATTVVGVNVIAIRARDRGTISYLNVKISTP